MRADREFYFTVSVRRLMEALEGIDLTRPNYDTVLMFTLRPGEDSFVVEPYRFRPEVRGQLVPQERKARKVDDVRPGQYL